ncbi:MAG TPA: hypothetical protein GXX28_03995 [Firmicutes bacterium]|nr:hypothetical protein [Bacillota bacterium]
MNWMRRIGVVAASFVVLALAGAGAQTAAPTPVPAPSAASGGSGASTDLLWLMAGLAKLDQEPGLKVTKTQASRILAVLKPLVDERILLLDAPQRRNGQSQGLNQRPQNATPEQLREFRKRRQEREARLRSALEAIDKILSAKQVEFIDNLDFDPAPYTVGRGGFGQMGQAGSPPTPAQLEQFRAKAQEALRKAAALNRKTYDLLVARAAGK